jgi:hypothetical protein
MAVAPFPSPKPAVQPERAITSSSRCQSRLMSRINGSYFWTQNLGQTNNSDDRLHFLERVLSEWSLQRLDSSPFSEWGVTRHETRSPRSHSRYGDQGDASVNVWCCLKHSGITERFVSALALYYAV